MMVRITVTDLVGAGKIETRTTVITEEQWAAVADQADHCRGTVTVEYLEVAP